MARVRVIEIPENRRDIHVDMECEVSSFKQATVEIARDLHKTASNAFRHDVMRLWAEHGKSGGFAVRNGQLNDSWVMFEYVEGE